MQLNYPEINSWTILSIKDKFYVLGYLNGYNYKIPIRVYRFLNDNTGIVIVSNNNSKFKLA